MARKKKSGFIPFLMLAVSLAAGGWLAMQYLPDRLVLKAPEKSAPETTAQKSGGHGGNIHAIDFRNHAYAPDCLRSSESGQQTVRTRDGVFERNIESDRVHFTVAGISHGDLTGDGRDEAVVLTSCNTGGSGVLDQGFVYGMRDGQLAELGRIETGSKAFGGIVSLQIQNSRVVVERYATDEDGAHCCPKYIDTTQLRWDGQRLVADGGSTRRKTTN